MSFSSIWAVQAEASQAVFASLAGELSAHFRASPGAIPARQAEKPAPYELLDGIAVIPVTGVIDRVARISFFTGLPYTQGQDAIRRSVNAALADPQVKGIMLAINSPGGVAAGTKELADFIARASREKPCAAYADGLCASAAYWLASATGRVYGPLTAQVGSIGVIAVLTEYTAANASMGIATTVLASGKWKAAGCPEKKLTMEEQALFQSQLESLHRIFKADVKAHMNIKSPESEWAEGQTLLGAEAVRAGLLSGLASDLADALAMFGATITKERIMDLAELKAKQPELYEAAKAESKRELEEERLAGLKEQADEMLALVAAVAGQETADKILALKEAGLTAAQIKFLGPMLAGFQAAAKSSGKSAEQQAREQILAGISQATGSALPENSKIAAKSSLIADAEARQRRMNHA